MATKQKKLLGIRKPRAASQWEKQLYVYDSEEEQLWLEVFPLFFKYIEGDEYGQPFQLLDYWMDIFLRFFCWKDRTTGRRRYREGFIFIPRKNGKTLTLAAVGLALLMILRIRNGQVYIIASDEDQGKIMFNFMVRMIEASEDLQEIFFCAAEYIEHVETGAQVKVLTSSKRGKTGLKPHVTIFDEYQEQKDDEQEMVMETGAIANKEPILIKIGTMGVEDETEKAPWKKALEHARKVNDDPRTDPSFMPIVYECTQDDDPSDPELWQRTNPGYGTTVDKISFQKLWDKAKDDPDKRRRFCQYNLNMPVSVSSEYVDLAKWKTLQADFTFDYFADKVAYGGLDLALTNDMVALTLLNAEWRKLMVKLSETESEETMNALLRLLPFYWAPTAAIKASEKKVFSYVPYVNAGLIKECGTHAISWTDLRRDVLKILKEVKIHELGFDPWRAGEMTEYLAKKKVTCVKIPQTFKVLDFPTNRFRDLINEEDILHNGNPVFLWNLKNCRTVSNLSKNIMLSKNHAAGKIDGVAAGINAVRVFMDAPPPKLFKQEFFSV